MKRIKSKKLFSLLMAVVMILQVFVITPTYAADDTRTKINKIVATSDTDSIPVYGGTVKDPTFTVTEGSPAYFSERMCGWLKKDGTSWVDYTGATFTEGTYKYEVQVRIDGKSGKTHKLDEDGTTVLVDGNKWADNETPIWGDDFSYFYVKSEEYTIEAPVGAPLDFVKNNSWNIGLNYVGKAIASFSVATGATGGEKPYTFSRVSGPDWISVASDGTVSGTPNGIGKNNDLVIRVTDKNSATEEITLSVADTIQDPSTRTKISKIVATSDTDTIPTYGGTVKDPTFTVTEGSPAYFSERMCGWLKKDGTSWVDYTGATFIEGTYKYEVQIRVDGDAGKTHVLDSKGVTATVDGDKWADNETPIWGDDFSYFYVKSEEYEISKTSEEKVIDIPTANTNLVYNGNPQTGVNEGTGYTLTDNTATNAGTHTAKATLNAGYKWSDGTTEVKEITWTIAKAIPEYTEPTNLTGKKGENLSTVTLPAGFTWVNGETVLDTVGKKTFKAKFTPTDQKNYEVIEVELTVTVEEVEHKITVTNGTSNPASAKQGTSVTVTATVPSDKEFDTWEATGIILTDAQKKENPLTITMPDNDITLTAKFKNKELIEIDLPIATLSFVYDGTEKVAIQEGTGYTLSNHKATNAGEYKATATLEEGYKWKKFGVSSLTYDWKIEKADPTYTVPTGLKVQKGSKLSAVTLPKGFTWVDGETILNTVGEKTFKAKYTPDDTNNYKEVEVDIKVLVEEVTPPTPTVTAISVNSTSHKTEYKVGEDLDVTNLTIEVTKSDGSKETVNVDKSMVTGFDSSAANPSQELTIIYEGKTATYTIKIEEEAPPTPTVTAIKVNSTNHKTDYKVGEELDVTNLTIEVTKSDGSKETVNVESFMVTGFNSSVANPNQELTITYEGKTTTYAIKIEEEAPPVPPTVTAIKVNSTNHKTDYKVGEELDVTNLTIEVTKSDGSKETVKVEKTMVTGFDSSAANPNQELTITYEGKTTTYTIKIEEVAPPTPTTYNVVINPVNHGKVDTDKKTASKDEVITLTIVADAGYEVESIDVKDVSGNKMPVTNNTFVMPESDVKVNVSFRAMPLPPTPPTPPTPSIPDDCERPHRPYRPYRPSRPSYEDKDDKREEKTEEAKKEIETKVVITIGSNQLDKDINGINNIITMDVTPYIKNGRTMLPVRYVAEALGFSVDWINETRTVIIQDMFFRVEIPVDTNLIIVNGVNYESDVKPEIVNGRTMLPIANIARALGLKDNVNIFWDAVNRKVTIIK